jgi:hypothetical protein
MLLVSLLPHSSSNSVKISCDNPRKRNPGFLNAALKMVYRKKRAEDFSSPSLSAFY